MAEINTPPVNTKLAKELMIAAYAIWCDEKKKMRFGQCIRFLQIQAVLLWGRNNFLFEIDDVLYPFFNDTYRKAANNHLIADLVRRKYMVKVRNHATNRKALYTLTEEGKKEADRLKELYNIHDLKKA